MSEGRTGRRTTIGKQHLGAIVAAGLLVAIFVPFQSVNALSMDFTNFPPSLPRSGIPQEITFDIVLEPSEVLSSSGSIEVQITPGTANPGDSFGTIDLSTGVFTASNGTGTPDNLLSDIAVTPGSSSVYGYAYAYAYAYGITDGWVGPLTITVTAKLLTGPLAPGANPVTHTIFVTVEGQTDSTTFDVVPGNVNVLVRSKVLGGSFFTGMDMHIKGIECDAGSPDSECHDVVAGSEKVPPEFTPITFTQNDGLIEGVSYFLYAAEFGTFEFDHWEDAAGNILTPTVAPVNPRGINFVAGPGLQFVAVYTDSSSSSTSTGGSEEDDERGGGGGGRDGSGQVFITWPPAQTLPESHFALSPLDKIQVASSAFLNAAGVTIAEGKVGQQISISGEFTNYQETAQDYAFIVQVLDENGVVTSIDWQESIIGRGSTAEISVLWTPEIDGVYTVKIFVWDGISELPTPLSDVTVKNLRVTE